MMLICQAGAGKDVKIRLKPLSHAPAITIGRGKEATICLDDAKCSRVHCAIKYWDDIFIIRDMNSSNGTFVNAKKIEVAKIAPGDIIRIGDTEFSMVPEETPTDVTMRG